MNSELKARSTQFFPIHNLYTTVFWCFQGDEMGASARNRLNKFLIFNKERKCDNVVKAHNWKIMENCP